MGLGVFLRYLRLVQILLVAIISISLAASFLKVGSNQLNDKGTSFSSVQGTGIVALLFGLTSLAELMLEYFVVRIGHHSVMSHTLSLGMAFFLNIFGIVLTMGSTHVIAVRPDLFDRELIYLSIGSIFLSLMIENFAQGRNFHAVVECKNKAAMKTMTKDTKVESSTEMVEVKSDTTYSRLHQSAEKPTNIEISVDSVAPVEDFEKTRQSKNGAAGTIVDDNEEVFTTPSVIPKDIRLTISDKELDTARKRLRKSVADSIFKIKHLQPETPGISMSLPRLSTYLEFPQSKQKKDSLVNDTDDVCVSINESVVEVEPLPEVTTLRTDAAVAAWLSEAPAPPESAVQDKKSPAPGPTTPSIWLEAPFHTKMELTPMPKSLDSNSNSIENTPNNTHQLN